MTLGNLPPSTYENNKKIVEIKLAVEKSYRGPKSFFDKDSFLLTNSKFLQLRKFALTKVKTVSFVVEDYITCKY